MPDILRLTQVADAPLPKFRNAQFVMVSHESHLDTDIGEAANGRVWVSSDWLTWQRLIQDGKPTLLLEQALEHWDADGGLAEEFMLRVSDPAYEDGTDMTMFHGTSLGRAFLTPAILLRAAALRIENAFRQLLEDYQPSEIVYLDSRAETTNLSEAQRFDIIREVANEFDVPVIDCRPSMPVPADDLPMLPEAFRQWNKPEPALTWKDLARSFAERTIDITSGLLGACDKRHENVLVMINTSMTRPLFNFVSRDMCTKRPLVFFRNQRKDFKFLLSGLKAGIGFVAHPRRRRLGEDDHRKVHAIVEKVRANLERAKGPANKVVASAMIDLLGDGAKFYKLAEEACAARRFLKKIRPYRIVVDTPKNPPHIFYAEIGQEMGVRVDYIWHSPMMPETFRTAFLGGDPRAKQTAARTLSWGEANDRWIKVVAATLPTRRIGSPIVGTYQNFGTQDAPVRRRKRALILEYSIVSRWLNALNATKYEYFIKATEILKAQGCRDIAVKLHPGRPSKTYYEKIVRTFGLDCVVLKSERLHDVLQDYDIVIGPIHSGAIFEAMAAGKEVYAFWLGPDDVVTQFYASYGLLRDISELADALKNRRSMDNHSVLADVYGHADAESVREQFWQAIGED